MIAEEGLAVAISAESVCGNFVGAKQKVTGEFNLTGFLEEWEKASPEKQADHAAAQALRKTDFFGVANDDSESEIGATEATHEVASKNKSSDPASLKREEKAQTSVDRIAAKHTFLSDFAGKPFPVHDWIIKYVIARKTCGILAGKWGFGKTAVAIDLGGHVALGIPFNGRKVKRGIVVYCGLENYDDIQRRWRTWLDCMREAGHAHDDPPVVIYHAPLTLFNREGKPTQDEKDLNAIIDLARSRWPDLGVAAIFIDTISKSIPPGNETDNAAEYVAVMQRLADKTGAAVIALGHPTKDGQSNVSGGRQFQGDVDCIWVIEQDSFTRGSFSFAADPDKFRIGDPSKVDFRFTKHGVTVDIDEDGEPITVVQVKWIDDPASRANCGVADDVMLHWPKAIDYESFAEFLLGWLTVQAEGLGGDRTAHGFATDTMRGQLRAQLDHFAPSSRRGGQTPKTVRRLEDQRRKQLIRAVDKLVGDRRIDKLEVNGASTVVKLRAA